MSEVFSQALHWVRREPSLKATQTFTLEVAQSALSFHKTLPVYAPTRLVSLSGLAHYLGIRNLYVKDESTRFGLNAFKVLGGSYCIHRYLATHRGPHTFITATDGNHGRGIAWTARQLQQKCVVLLPKGASQERLDNICALGAKVSISDVNYDDTVRKACAMAKEKGWVLVQDTSWPGYEQIPTWIMQGYTTLALECVQELKEVPTHIFLQAGVGAMAGAMCGFFANYYKAQCPTIIIVEPHKANCIYRTAKADDGQLHAVGGDLQTIMAGLACGEPCSIGWEQIQAYASYFASVDDATAAIGMRVLGNPVGEDSRVVSGESGAVTTGVVCRTMIDPSWSQFRRSIGLGVNSKVLCLSTEGDTDQKNYRQVVWGL